MYVFGVFPPFQQKSYHIQAVMLDCNVETGLTVLRESIHANTEKGESLDKQNNASSLCRMFLTDVWRLHR